MGPMVDLVGTGGEPVPEGRLGGPSCRASWRSRKGFSLYERTDTDGTSYAANSARIGDPGRTDGQGRLRHSIPGTVWGVREAQGFRSQPDLNKFQESPKA